MLHSLQIKWSRAPTTREEWPHRYAFPIMLGLYWTVEPGRTTMISHPSKKNYSTIDNLLISPKRPKVTIIPELPEDGRGKNIAKSLK